MKICVIHLNQIGDLVFSLPLLKTLRESYPSAEIHAIVKPYLKSLLEGSPLVNRIIGRPGGVKETINLIRTIRNERYDLLINLARSEETFILTALSSAGTRAGFVSFPWDLCLDVKETVIGHNCSYNNARLLGRLGMSMKADSYVGLLPVDASECSVAIPEPFVVISAGASRRRLIKAWDEEKFARLIVAIHKRYGLNPVLVGAADTKESNEKIAGIVKSGDGSSPLTPALFPTRGDLAPEGRGGLETGQPAVGDRPNDLSGKNIDVLDLTGKLNLRALAAMLMKARLFVGIDSGVMHLASAADCPVVALFGPTDPVFVGPQNEESIVVRHEMPCMPCYMSNPCKEIDCMRGLDADVVLEACISIMERGNKVPS